MEQTKPSQSLPDNAYRELKPGEEYVPMMPADAKPKEEKIRIVESLHHAGIFYMKGAVSEVAAQLGSSEATIYRYLSKLK